jgi:hypothetical protein
MTLVARSNRASLLLVAVNSTLPRW